MKLCIVCIKERKALKPTRELFSTQQPLLPPNDS